MIKKLHGVYLRLKPLLDKVTADNIFAIAGQSAFFLILSVIPLSIFALSIVQGLHLPAEAMNDILSGIFSVTVVNYAADFFNDVYNTSASVSLISLFITLWSAAQGIHSVTNGLNRVYGTYENRNWFVLRLRAMLYTAVFLVILIGSLLIIVLGSSINSMLSPYLSYLPDVVAFLYHLRYVVVFLYLTVLFALLYRNFPNIDKENRKKYSFRYQLPGALLCSTAWFALSLGISVYVDDFNGFSVYGGLTRLAVIMVWLYFCMVSLMLCAEFNYYFNDKIRGIKILKKK